jgi:hypothetical protein
MKFYNLYKLDVKVGDTVHYIHKNIMSIETVSSVENNWITAKSHEGEGFIYYRTGITPSPFIGLHELFRGRIHEIP